MLVAVCWVQVAFADDEPEKDPLAPRQWRVVWWGDASTSATICWNTKQAGKRHEVIYGPRGESQPKTAAAQRSGKFSGSWELHYHHCRIEGLKPGTAYEFQVSSDGKLSPKQYFVTAPGKDEPCSILFGGDSRTDRGSRQKVNRMMAEILASQRAAGEKIPNLLALAHGGDYVTWGSSLAQWNAWMTDHLLATTPEGRVLPVIPARGNHDRGPLFNEVFGFPAGDANQHVTRITPEVHLITLNTNESAAGKQAAWLKEQLAALRPKSRWLLAQYHRPAYPAVKRPGEALRYWVPLFEKYNLDMACEADGHNIKRTPPIRGGKQDPTGVVYIGEGGLGVAQRRPKTDRWYLKEPGMADVGHHVQVLTFGEEKLIYRCVLLGNKLREKFERPARKQAAAVGG